MEPTDDDMIRFPCQKCGKRLKAPPSARGKTGTCSRCQTKFIVPAATDEPGYERRTGLAEWTEVFSELTAEDTVGMLRPQLWLLCQTPKMAVTILANHPPSAAALLAGTPELAEFGDGQAAAIFPLRQGGDALLLLQALFAGTYDDELPVVFGGAAAYAPAEDLKQIISMFGRDEALSVGSVAVW